MTGLWAPWPISVMRFLIKRWEMFCDVTHCRRHRCASARPREPLAAHAPPATAATRIACRIGPGSAQRRQAPGSPARHRQPPLLSSRGGASANHPVFASRKDGHLTERAVNVMLRCCPDGWYQRPVSPHLLHHAHGSHAIDRGASLPEVQSKLGHGSIATTSGYLRALPNTSSGLHLDPAIFLR
jgi:integrase